MSRQNLLVLLALSLGALSGGCDRPVEGTDTGPQDSGIGVDAAGDTGGLDGAIDGGLDTGSTDGGLRDGGRDTPPVDAPRDAGPDVSAEVSLAVRIFCEPSAYANCSTAWLCGCDVGGPAPADVAACVLRERPACEREFEDDLTAFFRLSTVTIDEAALDACILELEHPFDLCVPPEGSADRFPRSCWDAITVGLPVGATCEFPGVRCADGAGVCTDGRRCEAAAAAAGEACDGTCVSGLACVEGSCAEPVAVGGACRDHEDCVSGEPCIGGRCGDPSAAGASCDDVDECATGLTCESSGCATRFSPRCTVGSADCGAASECRPSFRNVCRLAFEAGASCESDSQCMPGLICDFSVSFPGTCAPRPGLGERCSGACQEGLRCLQDFSGDATCEVPRGPGARCDDVFSREGPICQDGLGCTGGVCATAPRLGERCSDDGVCEVGLACVFDDTVFEQLCSLRQPEGGRCNDDRQCNDNLFCDFSTFPALCTPLPREGSECNGRCEPELDCRFFDPLGRSYCVPPSRLGDECSSLCTAGAFCGFDDTAGTCFRRVCDFVFPVRT